jgi:hypothetical protein
MNFKKGITIAAQEFGIAEKSFRAGKTHAHVCARSVWVYCCRLEKITMRELAERLQFSSCGSIAAMEKNISLRKDEALFRKAIKAVSAALKSK